MDTDVIFLATVHSADIRSAFISNHQTRWPRVDKDVSQLVGPFLLTR